MISEPTKVQDPMFVDDPSGNKQSIKGAGMAPNFVEKKVQFIFVGTFYYFVTKPTKLFRHLYSCQP